MDSLAENGGGDKLRLLISGESHGHGYIGILEGLPAGLLIDEEKQNCELYKYMQNGHWDTFMMKHRRGLAGSGGI